MFINASNYHNSDKYLYNSKDGTVTRLSIKKSLLNNWLNKCRDEYEDTNKGSEPSVFFGMNLFNIPTYIVIFVAYSIIGGIESMYGVYWIVGILTTLDLLIIFTTSRDVFWYVPFVTCLLFILSFEYAIPWTVHTHVETCQEAHEIIVKGKDAQVNCCYSGYIINHLDEFK